MPTQHYLAAARFGRFVVAARNSVRTEFRAYIIIGRDSADKYK
jgi:hypothetical protein